MIDIPLTIGLLVTAIGLLYSYLRHIFSYWQRKGFPYAKPSIPYGNMKGGGNTEQITFIFDKLYKELKPQGPVGGIYLFTSPTALIMETNLLKHILIKDFQYFVDRGTFYNEKDDPLSAHLFSIEGDKWRQLRNKLSPTFTSGKMKFMFPIVVDVAKRFEKFLLESVPDSKDFEIKEPLARFTTDVIGSCAFGIECNSLADPNAEFRVMGKKVFGEPRVVPAFILLFGAFPNIARKLGMKVTQEDVEKFFMGIVRETVNYRESNNVQRNDFMDILIKLKNSETNSLTLNEISAQAFLFFLGGFETSSTTMMFVLYELARNQDIQTKVRNEINSVIKKYQEFTYEAMINMNYLDQVINESLRMYPPASSLIRKANDNYKIPGTNKIIEKGVSVIIPVYSIHHDPDNYQDPEKFLPERFAPEESAKRESVTFLPFGDGPRNCVGLRFGMMQTRVGLVYLLRNFEISFCSKTPDPIVFNPQTFVLTSINDINLHFRKI